MAQNRYEFKPYSRFFAVRKALEDLKEHFIEDGREENDFYSIELVLTKVLNNLVGNAGECCLEQDMKLK